MNRSVLTVVLVVVSFAVLSGCSSAPKCGVSTCAGCCSASGECVTGNSNAACGANGADCQPCANTQACTFGQCVNQNLTGGGSGGGAGGGGGGSGTDGGVADGGACAACRFGEFCELDGGAATCTNDYDPLLRPYCDACALPGTCGGRNFCLLSGSSSACGVDCSRGQACPLGYSCQDVAVVLTRLSCSTANACPGNPTLPCATSADCRFGATCVGNVCTPPCVGNFCGCLVDADCVQETCNAGSCSITGGACSTETDCEPITCVASAGAGRCLIGRNCSPTPGLTCADVK